MHEQDKHAFINFYKENSMLWQSNNPNYNNKHAWVSSVESKPVEEATALMRARFDPQFLQAKIARNKDFFWIKKLFFFS